MSRPQPVITPYRSFGAPDALWVRGRVLYDKHPDAADALHSRWRNLRNALRRIESDEAPGVVVEGSVGDQRVQAVTDREGYFELNLTPAPAPKHGWCTVQLRLLPTEDTPTETASAVAAEVLIPSPNADYGVISDIDDTILKTQATSLLHSALVTLLENAATRLPFPGVAALYQAFQAGRDGGASNPIFYVSSSPWNFYDFLVEFMQLHDIPPGPLLLRDYGLDMLTSALSHDHKLASMRCILNAYPTLPFVLLGDSGQKDPELYTQLASEYPGRVLAIFIRDVSDDRRDETVDTLAAVLHAVGVPLLRVADSLVATEAAIALGLLPATTGAAVQAAMIQTR